MIITRTPLRVTLGGGGTDLESYYSQNGGFIFALALNKYIYVSAHRPQLDSEVVLHGQSILRAPDTLTLPDSLFKSALGRHGIASHFEAATVGEIQGGTGLGSSSCFLVGFLNALHALQGRVATPHALAEEACDIEITKSSNGIGKQDQYMAAFGGLTTLEIAPDGEVKVEKVTLPKDVETAFIARTRIYYTGLRRDAAVILNDQNMAMRDDRNSSHQRVSHSLDSIKELGYRIRDAWRNAQFEDWGHMLHEHWLAKKAMSKKISWSHIDTLYEHVREHYGVLGGKVIGAGGGGFLMLFTMDTGDALDAFMQSQNMPRLHYEIDEEGTKILHSNEIAVRAQ